MQELLEKLNAPVAFRARQWEPGKDQCQMPSHLLLAGSPASPSNSALKGCSSSGLWHATFSTASAARMRIRASSLQRHSSNSGRRLVRLSIRADYLIRITERSSIAALQHRSHYWLRHYKPVRITWQCRRLYSSEP